MNGCGKTYGVTELCLFHDTEYPNRKFDSKNSSNNAEVAELDKDSSYTKV